jgi:hypothetical protein
MSTNSRLHSLATVLDCDSFFTTLMDTAQEKIALDIDWDSLDKNITDFRQKSEEWIKKALQ